MEHYRSKSVEWMREGFTDLFVVQQADLAVGFSNQQIVLAALAKGDLVQDAVMDVVAQVTGPTGLPTAQVKVHTAAVAITNTGVVAISGVGAVKQLNNDGACLLGGADNLVLDLQAGGGHGAAATAGEIWVWANLSWAADRLTLQV